MKVSRRLELALRKNRGRQLRVKFMDDLKQNLGASKDSIRILNLEETDLIWELVQAKWSSCLSCSAICFQKSWKSSEVSGLDKTISKLKTEAPFAKMILFRPLSEFCGAVETSWKAIFDHAFQLVNLDQDELIVSNEDASVGIILTYNTEKYDNGDVGIYELLVWGDKILSVLGDTS